MLNKGRTLGNRILIRANVQECGGQDHDTQSAHNHKLPASMGTTHGKLEGYIQGEHLHVRIQSSALVQNCEAQGSAGLVVLHRNPAEQRQHSLRGVIL